MKRKSYWIEILVSGLLLVAMTAVRFSYILNHITAVYGDMGFLEMSMIRQGTEVPYLPKLIEQLYAYGLRLVFWLAGNKEMAVVYVQAALQIAALFALFLACRKLCGIVYSSIVLLAVLFLKQGLWLMGELTPGHLLLVLTGGYFLLFAIALGRIKEKRGNQFFFVFGFFVTGLYCGVLAALDSYGLVLMLLSIILIGCVRSLPVGFLLGSVLGAGGVFLTKSACFGLSFEKPYLEYYENYLGCDNWNMFLRYGVSSLAVGLFTVLFFFAFIGFAWQLRRARLKAAAQMQKPALPKIYISDIDSLPVPKLRTIEAATESMGVREKTEETAEHKESKKENKQENKKENKKEIKYIENPLPVPKRHVKKEMTYAFEPDDAHMCFDINELSGDSDFDVE